MKQGEIRRVEIADMSAARERRALRQIKLSADGCTVISLLMNIPGAIKRSKLFDCAFYEGYNAVKRCIESFGWGVSAAEKEDLFTGLEARWAVVAEPRAVKRELCAIEEAHSLGRFWDIDVIAEGESVSRTELGLSERGCMLCGASGRGCARSRAHSVEELISFMEKSCLNYFNQRTADSIAAKATEALLCEVCVTPKPGLVDCKNNGSHSDMDLFTFLKSAAALTTYFRDAAACGIETAAIPTSEVLGRLRGRGMLAEQQMLAATGGVNTHKGAVFSLGIACAALGRLCRTEGSHCEKTILSTCGEIAQGEYSASKCATNGSRAKERYGAGGIRAEAAKGFPAVRDAALPAFKRAVSQGLDFNAAAVAALLSLIAALEDTNMISRVGFERAAQLKEKAAEIIEKSADANAIISEAAALDKIFIKENASPGGCADMLALCLLIWLWQKKDSDF